MVHDLWNRSYGEHMHVLVYHIQRFSHVVFCALLLPACGPPSAHELDMLIEQFALAEWPGEDWQAFNKATEKLAKAGGAAIPHLLYALEDERPWVRYGVLHTLVQMEARIPDAAPLLMTQLNDPASGIRRCAISALATCGAPDDVIVPSLINALADDEAANVSNASERLAAMGAPVIPFLLDALESVHPQQRQYTALILGDIGLGSMSVISPLTDRLEDEDHEVRAAVVHSLGNLRVSNPAVIYALAGRLIDPEMTVRQATLAALTKIGEPAHITAPTLIRSVLVGKSDPYHATDALVAMGPSVVRLLIFTLSSHDPELRFLAVRSIAGIGRPAREAIPALIEHLREDPAPQIRYFAAEALTEMGPLASAAIPTLIDAMLISEGEPYDVSFPARLALAEIGDAAVPALADLMESDDIRVRDRAAWLLMSIDTNAAHKVLRKHKGRWISY